MSTPEHVQPASKVALPAPAAIPRAQPPRQASPSAAYLLHLQATAGNRAVQRLVARNAAPVQRLTDEDEDKALDSQAYERNMELRALGSLGRTSRSVGDGGPARFDMPELSGPATRWAVSAAGPPGNDYAKVPTGDSTPQAPLMVPASVGAGAVPAGGAGGSTGAGPSAGAGEARALDPLKLPAKYADEDKRLGWRAHAGIETAGQTETEQFERRATATLGKNRVTKYNSPDERAASTLTPSGGQLRNAQGAASSTPPRTDRAAGTGTEYAMSPTGEIVTNQRAGSQLERVPFGAGERDQVTHHSTMFAGADVAHAGHLGTTGGKVDYLDDDSGHYRPTEEHTRAAFGKLDEQGVLAETGHVRLVGKQGTKGVDLASQDSVTVPFHGYRQTAGDEGMIRARDAAFEQIDDKRRAAIPAKAAARAAELASIQGHNARTAAVAKERAAQIAATPGKREEIEAMIAAELSGVPMAPPQAGAGAPQVGAGVPKASADSGARSGYASYLSYAGMGEGAEAPAAATPAGAPGVSRVSSLYPGSAGDLPAVPSAESASAEGAASSGSGSVYASYAGNAGEETAGDGGFARVSSMDLQRSLEES